MKFKLTTDGVNGTHLQGTINATYARLVEVFGEPNCNGDAYKVQKEWIIKFEDGTIATIYDWKEGDNHYTNVTDWHIGGFSDIVVTLVNAALEGDSEPDDGEPRYTEDQIADAAEKACFYVTPGGLWLRMEYCSNDEGYFMAIDEDSGEEYRFDYVDLVYEEPEFHKLEKMAI